MTPKERHRGNVNKIYTKFILLTPLINTPPYNIYKGVFKMHFYSYNPKSGFSIIELAITIMIIGIIAAIAIPEVITYRQTAKLKKDFVEINNLRTTLSSYMTTQHRLPFAYEVYQQFWKCHPPEWYSYVIVNGEIDNIEFPPVECNISDIEPPYLPRSRCTPVLPEYALKIWRDNHKDDETALGYFIVCQHNDHGHRLGSFVYADDRQGPTIYSCPKWIILNSGIGDYNER